MHDHLSHSDIPPIQIHPESPLQPWRDLESAIHDSPWSTHGAQVIDGEGSPSSIHRPEGSLWEINQDRAHSMHSPIAPSPQPSIPLSPLLELLGDFDLSDPFSGAPQVSPSSEQDYRCNDVSLYSNNYHYAPTSDLENLPSYFTQPTSHNAFLLSRDSTEIFEPRSPVIRQSYLTDGNYATTYTTADSAYRGSMGSPSVHLKYRDSTSSSVLASLFIETPSPIHSDLSPLSSSPLNSPSSRIESRGVLSVPRTPDNNVFFNYEAGPPSNSTHLAGISLTQYTGTGNLVSSRVTPSPNTNSFSPSNLSYGLEHSHNISHSAPPSPSSLSAHQNHARRGSHSGGSNYLSQRTAYFSSEPANIRQNTRINANGGNISPVLIGTPDYQPNSPSQRQSDHEGSSSGVEISSNSNFKDTIASTATLEASKKRRKKSAGFSCHICPQWLTSKDNLKSHIDAHMGWKRFACEHCDRRFRTRSVLSRHQKSKICPGSTLLSLKKKHSA